MGSVSKGTMATRFRHEKTTSVEIRGTFDEIIGVMKKIPMNLDITLRVAIMVTDPETYRLVVYHLPVLSSDKGKEAKNKVDGLFKQARLTEKEYNDVMDRLIQIRKIMGADALN